MFREQMLRVRGFCRDGIGFVEFFNRSFVLDF